MGVVEDLPHEELKKWFQYFNQRPIGWREDFRAYRIMQAFGTKEPIEKVFESARMMKTHNAEAEDKPNPVKLSGILGKLGKAVGGETIPL